MLGVERRNKILEMINEKKSITQETAVFLMLPGSDQKGF